MFAGCRLATPRGREWRLDPAFRPSGAAREVVVEHAIVLGVDALTLAGLYLLIGIGYAVAYSVLGIFHFVHGDVAVMGGMVGVGILLLLDVGMMESPFIWLALVVALVCAAAAGAAASVAIERGVYRRLRARSRITPLIAAIGLSLVLENVLMLTTSKEPILVPPIVIPQGAVTLGPVHVLSMSLVVMLAALACLAATVLLLRRSDIGTAMRAIAQDQEAAEFIGLPTGRLISTGFALAGALAGIGGVLLGMYAGSLKWSDGLILGIKGFAAALIGGLGSVVGAGLGAVILAGSEIFGVGIRVGDFQLDNAWRETVAFLVVIVVLLVRPEGILRRGARTWQVRN